MFRIGLKFPCNGLNRVKKHGYSRLYLTARYYETRARVKCEPEGRLCKDVRLMSRFSGPKYSTQSPKSEKNRGSGSLITLGAVTISAIGVLTFAKKNPEFRATLEEWIPGTDHAIQIIFQEDSTYFDFIRNFFETLKQTILDLFFGQPPSKEAPKPAFEPLVDKKEPPINEPYSEIRLSKEKGEAIQVVAEKPLPPPKDVPAELMPANLVELEAFCGQAASKAIAAYHKAICAIQDYNKDVIKVVESAGGTIGGSIHDRLKEATEKRKEALKTAELYAGEAVDSLRRMYNLIDDPKFDAPPVMKTVARRNVKKILDDVDESKRKYEEEVQSSRITEKFWKQVEKARQNFNEELQILFPDINIHEKKLSVNEDSFDLFVLHMYNKINNLQKDLERLETIQETKLKNALKASGDDSNQAKIEALICAEVNKEKRYLREEFEKKLLEEKKRFDDEMRKQLKLQAQIHADHLREALHQKELETQRAVGRALSEQAENESTAYKMKLAAVVGRMQGLDHALKARLEEEKGASDAQMLWAACQTLARALKLAPPGIPAEKALRPLEPEIKAVSKAAPKEDPLVRAAIQGIPEEAVKRGVFPEDALRERFFKVENMARRLALVPENGASLPIYLLSYLQSFLLVKAISPISKTELQDEPFDVQSLSTYDILQRARYWVDRGDFKMALRYMNLLQGAPRCVAREWMNEARILLETQQAVDTLIAYAGATGLVFLGGGDSSQTKK
ncbi:MICOS complex subunit Mic60 isoform X2 [Cephus cinctus]|uniref:MICOS complex subunit MIC60 n=1 Tax=Cephus cinctus TaxID=211228 RepID=A0AAJ7BY34_CEPCN|nr:MICOS complex subunit Mic60 isoform X2 [Cephus cinctus]